MSYLPVKKELLLLRLNLRAYFMQYKPYCNCCLRRLKAKQLLPTPIGVYLALPSQIIRVLPGAD